MFAESFFLSAPVRDDDRGKCEGGWESEKDCFLYQHKKCVTKV